MVQETSTTWKGERANQDGGTLPVQDQEAANEGNDASMSYSNVIVPPVNAMSQNLVN